MFHLHGALGVGISKRGARVEIVGGNDLRGVGGNNIHNRQVMNYLVHILLHLPHPENHCYVLCLK